MKKTPWEKWEVDFLREVAATMPVEVIAEKLERTEKAVMAKATRIGADIVSRLRGRRWTRAEVSLFGKFSAEEIAIATCRSIYSVRAMRYKLKKLDEERAGIRIEEFTMRGLAYNPGILPAEMIIRQRVKPMPSREELLKRNSFPSVNQNKYLNAMWRSGKK